VKPLPEQFDVADPNEAYAAALLKDVGPLEPSATRKRRVWNALQLSAAKRPRTRLSVPVVAGLVLFGATAASATLPQLWRRFQPAALEVPAIATESAVTTRRMPRGALAASKGAGESVLPGSSLVAPTTPDPALPPIDPSATPAQPSRAVAPSPVAREPASVARKQASAKSRAATAAEVVDPPASAALMVEAMRERRAGNLSRARELSSEYRLKYPGGALQEEALALSIEATAALGDDEARRLSAVYLQRYPHGRFRAQAQRVLDNLR
jgi:hypothetical protein